MPMSVVYVYSVLYICMYAILCTCCTYVIINCTCCKHPTFKVKVRNKTRFVGSNKLIRLINYFQLLMKLFQNYLMTNYNN